MKLTELKELLGHEINLFSSKEKINELDIERANAISRMARQVINNARMILESEKYKDDHHVIE